MINETKIKVQHITFKSAGTCSGCGMSGWGWGVWGGVGECGLELRSSMAKINDRHIPDKYSSHILEQICKISLKWLHFKTQSGNYHIGRIHVKHYWNQYTGTNITDTNIKIQLLHVVFNIEYIYPPYIDWGVK